MRKGLIFVFLVMASAAVAQQKIQISQYMLNQFLLNPAVAGTAEWFEVTAGYRMQWVGLEGAPRTFYLTAHGPLTKAHEHYNWRSKKHHHHSLGLYLANDKVGVLSRTLAYGAYAFNKPLTRKLRLSAGAFVGMQQHKINGDEVVMKGMDPSLPDIDITELVPDVSLGLWLYSDEYYLGVSAMQILRNRLDYSINNPGSGELGRLSHHWYVTGGLNLPIYYDWQFIPSLMVKYVHGAPVTFDANAKFKYLKKYWAGLSYRHFDAVSILIGMTAMQALHIGYSFDWPISDLSPFTHGSHEIVVGYSIGRYYDVLSPQMFW